MQTLEDKIDYLIREVAIIKANSERIVNDVDDHECRLREVESFRNQFKGAVISIGFASGFLGTIIGIIASLLIR